MLAYMSKKCVSIHGAQGIIMQGKQDEGRYSKELTNLVTLDGQNGTIKLT